MSNNTNKIKSQQQAKRQQEDAALNRILIWFGAAVVAEFVLLLISRFTPTSDLLRFLTVLVPAVAVLAVIYYLFQHDFFCISLISAGGLLSLLLYRKLYYSHPGLIRCGYVLALLLLAAAVVVLILLQKGKRPLPLGIDKLVPRDANFPLLYATCALIALLLILTLVLGGTLAYYFLFLIAGWLFITAVYYVVKLM